MKQYFIHVVNLGRVPWSRFKFNGSVLCVSQVKLIPSAEAATDEALSVYKRYQIGVHKDPPQKISRKSFENFLVGTPLQVHTSTEAKF